jgi:hypothetical protein
MLVALWYELPAQVGIGDDTALDMAILGVAE